MSKTFYFIMFWVNIALIFFNVYSFIALDNIYAGLFAAPVCVASGAWCYIRYQNLNSLED